MESKAIDAVDFREAQHKHWDLTLRWDGRSGASSITSAAARASASGWWSSLTCSREAGSLDVAAGYGEPALTAARKAGTRRAALWRTDISAEMLAFGRERAAAAGLGNVEFMESDASSRRFSARELRRRRLALGNHLRA